MNKKHLLCILLALTLLIVSGLTGCANTGSTTNPTIAPTTADDGSGTATTPTGTVDDGSGTASAVDTVNNGLTAEFTNFDRNTTFDSLNPTITLNGTTAVSSDSTVTVADGRISITVEGTYVISGTLTDGQIYVNVSDSEKVHLILNNASITCSFGPAIYIENADKTTITLADGTLNSLTDGTSYLLAEGEKANACLYSKDDLSINGTGTLTVTGNYNNGIDTNNDLRIVSGTITVTAVNNAVKGNDSIAILDGIITVNAQNDGFKTDTEGEAEKGFFYMEGGTLDITASDDGIQAVTSILISGGSVTFHVLDDRTNCDGTTEIADGIIK